VKRYVGLESLKFKAEALDWQKSLVRDYFSFEDVLTYKNKIPFAVDEETGEVALLPIKKSFRLLVVGKTGSGKSFLQTSIWSRAVTTGLNCCLPTDVKPEFWACDKPLQEKFRKKLLKNEKPVGMPIKVYYPYFFTKLIDRHFDHRLIQISLQQINYYDFVTLLGFKDLSDAKAVGLEFAFENVREGKITNFKEMKNFIKKLTDITTTTKNVLIRKIDLLERLGVIGNRFEDFSFTEDVMKDEIPVLNLCGFTEMGRYTNYVDAYLAIIVRDLLTSKQHGIIGKDKKLLIVIEETPRFIPAIGSNSAKRELIEGLHLGRIWGVSWIYSAQSHIAIDEEVIQNVDYVLIPSNYDCGLAIDLIKRVAPWMYYHPLTFGVDIRERMGAMDKYEWIFIDRREKVDYNVSILPPLCYHLEES